MDLKQEKQSLKEFEDKLKRPLTQAQFVVEFDACSAFGYNSKVLQELCDCGCNVIVNKHKASVHINYPPKLKELVGFAVSNLPVNIHVSCQVMQTSIVDEENEQICSTTELDKTLAKAERLAETLGKAQKLLDNLGYRQAKLVCPSDCKGAAWVRKREHQT